MNKVALTMVATAVIAVTMLWLMYHRTSASQMAAPEFWDLVLSQLRAEFPNRSFRASPGSRGLKLEAFKKGDTSFVAVGGDDGYAAARIMLPGLRTLLGEKLGFPFNFGVPNRDFLICWSASGDEGSRQFVTGRLKADFEQQPYPLSASVFQMAADGTITEEAQAQQ